MLDAGKDFSCRTVVKSFFYTTIIDISMVVENVKILGIAEKLYIYIYIYIYYLSNLLIFLLNNYIIP